MISLWPGSSGPACRSAWLRYCLWHQVLLCGLLVVGWAAREEASAAVVGDGRTLTSLNGAWLFQRDKAASNEWKVVSVPSTFQSHEGTNFHGVGWYRKNIEQLQVPDGHRILVHFQAAATEAEVWLNGERVGTHLGGWTPFRIDVTEQIRKSPGRQELLVRLDEKAGHNTQGFLPIIAPHFGGIWQEVSLITVPETYLDDLSLMAIGEIEAGRIRLEVPVCGSGAKGVSDLAVRFRLFGQEPWTIAKVPVKSTASLLEGCLPIPDIKVWSPADPNLYELEITLPGAKPDRVATRAAFRSFAAFGPELRLNDRPVSLRGLLNWGFSPPLLEPNPGEAVWRSELEFAKANGFNLMKFCLWVPPKRYLELADEMGVLTWMEYPTWHPDFGEKYLEPLRREFREFFRYDRNHPSVVLRSLTCETGPSAALSVIKSLYDTAHEMIPGALVEDDSSWIGWNRVHDFYDDHPYGNNHTWVKTLGGFNQHILAHGLKPLVLGESIAADTWVDRPAALKRFGSERPWFAPAVLNDMERWTAQMRELAGPGGLEELRSDSLHYGMLMRKYQMETYRREVPYGGYVITVLRDIPKASMGLIDYHNRPKWTSREWRWHRETICLLETPNDRRGFVAGNPVFGDILLSHFGLDSITNGEIELTLEEYAGSDELAGKVLKRQVITNIVQNCGTLARLLSFSWATQPSDKPQHLVIRAVLQSNVGRHENWWPIWLVPNVQLEVGDVHLHENLGSDIRELLRSKVEAQTQAKIIVASRFDPDLAQFLESGGRVLVMPDGQRHSFSLSSHWFLRGAPYIPNHRLSGSIPRDLLLELQHFDLASQVVPELPQIESFSPILMLWDTHDLERVKTHGLVFETKAGKGRLLVSTLPHADNPVGRWILAVFLDHLRSDATPGSRLPDEVWAYLKGKLRAEQLDLGKRDWEFRPDPKDEGLVQGWHKPGIQSEEGWSKIRVGAWWESQGHAAVDGWAWYRLKVQIPSAWTENVFLSFEGVDDCYELYVNGELVGRGGDLATRKDALNERKSYEIGAFAKAGESAHVAVRVYDWHGAGGIFRPVTLGTQALNPALDLLK